VDVSVYRVSGGRAVAFNDGEDPVTLPHEVQALPGNKFTTRILKEKGTYYIRVHANHPEYKLRTRVYDPPPYSDPRQAVRTAVDYILGAGDSWHANTPRRGGIFDRVSNVHQETSLCVACHPTHFSLRAQMYAAGNGYPVVQRQQAQFLTERFYNNPRPFYGFEQQGAVWARVISAPANVLGRMSVLLDLYEQEITGHRRDTYHKGVAEYLKLYYKDRDKLPPDETNGNTPLVSAYEVAWYAWRATRDEKIARLVEQDAIKNMIDLCYQTLALADIDRARHAEKIRRNAERILSLQRPDGQWSMKFEPDQAEVEFQTGHALWALQAAGIPADHPQVAKSIQYLLKRQQPFGGWMDPLQSFENFRTPFRETQMAVLGLSAYFRGPRASKGWNTKPPEKLAHDPATLLNQLDNLWDNAAPRLVDQLLEATGSNETLVRQQAIEALGRVAPEAYAKLLAAGLGDRSKLVQRTAAWAGRQIYNRSETAPAAPVVAALGSADARTRWGATRIFAVHFSALARRPEFLAPLVKRVSDAEPTVQMQALKGLWQYWFWTPDSAARDRIEDTFLKAMAKPQHPWVDRNLREGIYNIADENIRYFYNNWIPLLASPEDRVRVIRGRLAVEDRLSRKFAQVLETGSDAQRKTLLAGLSEYHLRRGDVYDPKADHSAVAPPLYNRIGNDVEQIVFFGASNDRFAKALLPLLDSPDAEMRRLATQSALLARSVKFPGVNAEAGPEGAGHKALKQAVERSHAPAEVLAAFSGNPPPAKLSQRGKQPTGRFPKPDESYFRGYVEPILETRGKDGYACVHCHASHTLFNGTYSTVMNVVDLNDPENSLILRKPTSSSQSEGTLGSTQLSHGGAVRWEKDSPEYRTILNWIKGAK
jgi:HEAT repeat protein